MKVKINRSKINESKKRNSKWAASMKQSDTRLKKQDQKTLNKQPPHRQSEQSHPRK